MPKGNHASAACTFLLFFLLMPVSPHCRTGTAGECQENEEFVPGHNLAGEGIDITTLGRKGAKLLDMTQWQKPDGTCTLCQNPLLEGKPLQRLPLACADWEANVACQRKVHTSLQASGLSVVQAAGSDVKNDWKVGLDVQVKPQVNTQLALAGSHSKMADFSADKSSQDKYSFASHEVSCSHYRYCVGHHRPLAQHFKHNVKNLPEKYNRSSQLEYRQLIETYGTHFITQLHLGGARTADECQENEEFVPGHNLAGEGIDITTLERKGAKLLDMTQWQKPDGTCTLCQNPLLEGKPLQRLPLACADWEANVACQRKVRTSLQASGLSVVQAAGSDVKNDWKVGLDVQVKPQVNTQVALAGSHSKMADFSADKSSQDKYSFASHEVSCSYYRFRIGHHRRLSQHFKNAVKVLPKKYNRGSQLEYRLLIQTFGTHFITQLHLGGRVRDVTAIRVCETVLDGVSADEVKDCLSIEAAVSIGDGKGKADAAYNTCEEQKKKKNFKGSFHQMYSERHTEIVGGNQHVDLLFADGQSTDAYSQWLEGVKYVPGLISYSLESIHALVSKEDPRRESLREAVSEYVRERALWRNCTKPCPPGTQRSVRDVCSCVCPGDGTTNSMCCSRHRGLAKLTVTIQRAQDLWGDHTSRTDAYVKVFYQMREMRTYTVWNDDNPTWKVHLDYGNIQLLGEASKLLIQVWDEDNQWDDDLLGSCEVPLQAGEPHSEVCYLNHGRLEFQYHLVCGPYLGGPYCFHYFPQQPRYVGALLQRKETEAVTQRKT
ncbi:hypothetical protein lerEdw1_013164 [Lerista edwardsae]|nr:hypothetical protein lerEdw1_013164 [Lerista edwardsae]